MYGSLEFLVNCNYDYKKLYMQLPLYYKQMMRDWKDIRINDNFNECLYNKKNILYNNRMIFNKKLLSLGLWYVSDMFVNNRLLDFEVWVWKNRGLSCCDYF